MTKLLLLDKDGTLVEPASGAKFVNVPHDQQLLPGVEQAIALASQQGWKISVCSNQGGIEAGHKTLESCFAEMAFLIQLIPQIEDCFFCPSFSGDDCWKCWDNCAGTKHVRYGQKFLKHITADPTNKSFRKPGGGMLFLVRELYEGRGKAIEEMLYVGDRAEDEGAAKAAGIKFLLADIWRDVGAI